MYFPFFRLSRLSIRQFIRSPVWFRFHLQNCQYGNNHKYYFCVLCNRTKDSFRAF